MSMTRVVIKSLTLVQIISITIIATILYDIYIEGYYIFFNIDIICLSILSYLVILSLFYIIYKNRVIISIINKLSIILFSIIFLTFYFVIKMLSFNNYESVILFLPDIIQVCRVYNTDQLFRAGLDYCNSNGYILTEEEIKTLCQSTNNYEFLKVNLDKLNTDKLYNININELLEILANRSKDLILNLKPLDMGVFIIVGSFALTLILLIFKQEILSDQIVEISKELAQFNNGNVNANITNDALLNRVIRNEKYLKLVTNIAQMTTKRFLHLFNDNLLPGVVRSIERMKAFIDE